MSRRTRRTLLIVAALLVLVALAVFLRSKAPPEAARLLPESDGIIYVDLRPIRAFFHKGLKPPDRVQDYQQFVDATGQPIALKPGNTWVELVPSTVKVSVQP